MAGRQCSEKRNRHEARTVACSNIQIPAVHQKGNKEVSKNKKKSKFSEKRQYLFVIRELTSREIKRKYARSYLGILWSVLNPLLTMIVMSLIFSTMFHRSIENFPIYYLTGNIIWILFSTGTNTCMNALVDNRTLLLKVKLPKQVFVLARAYTAFVNFLYTCVAYALVLAAFRIEPTWTMALFPVVVLLVLLVETIVIRILLVEQGLKHLLGYLIMGQLKILQVQLMDQLLDLVSVVAVFLQLM